MESPPKVRRTAPEIVTLEPAKTNSVKENIPPSTSMEKPCNQNGSFMDIQRQCQATPKKCAPNEDPVTPNTNFKLLTSLAATLDYANCNSLKPKEEDSCSNEGTPFYGSQPGEDYDNINLPNPPSRKEKSLSIICKRFLDIFPLYPASSDETMVVSLDEVSTKLAIERRRLYDIVNVFESIEMLSKMAKNRYLWYGNANLTNALLKLKNAAFKESVLEKLQYVLEFEENLPASKQSCILEEVRDFNMKFEYEKSSSMAPEILSYPSPVPELRKEKSLAIMSQKFLMLFLVSPTKIISLGVAAKVLNGFQNNEKGAQIKTQIRRLYDIANVLSSIGLIKKEVTIGQNGRKPAFQYIGPDLQNKTETPSKESQKKSHRIPTQKLKPKSLVRHSSFQEICEVAEIERKKIFLEELPNSAPPFQTKFQSFETTPEKTNFSDLKLNLDSKKVSPPSYLKDLQNLPLLQNNQTKTFYIENKKLRATTRSVSLPRQSSLKLINVPKQMLSANSPFYIVNPNMKEGIKSPTPMGTVLLISPIPVNKAPKEVKVVPEKKVPATKTLQLSAEQRDTILKSLNLSLSDGQIAAIQLEGSSQFSDSEIKPRCNLLKIIEKHEQNTSSVTSNHSKSFPKNEVESSDRGTKNTSPSIRFFSPINLPSGLITPVPSSDNSLISNAENIPEKSDNQVSELHFKSKIAQNEKFDFKNEIKTECLSPIPLVKGIKRKSDVAMEDLELDMPLKDLCNSYSAFYSSGSDGLNTEVSNILNGEAGKRLSNINVEPFLIDEKTILSPIKKQNKSVIMSKHLTPTSFTTPPYTVHDTYFQFNNLPC